jgi:putative ABC transport system permease protein
MFPSFLTWLDFRFAARRLVRTAGFTTAAVLLLAIAIGGTTFVFSVVRGLLLQPIPYVDAKRLVVLSPFAVEWDVLEDLREQRGVFDRVAVYTEREANLTGHGRAERVLTGRVTLDYLPITGVRPLLGLLFDEYEFNAVNDPVVIITDRVWRQRYAHSGDVIGQTLTIDGRAHRIVGVLPPDFQDDC